MAASTRRPARSGRLTSATVRKCLSYGFREGEAYRVRFGPIRGIRLHYDPSVNVHPILGLWDGAEEYAFLHRILSRGAFLCDRMVIADVGASLGIFSLWITRLLDGREHQVFAFEPARDKLSKLRSNIAINGRRSIQVVPVACADRDASAELSAGFDHDVSSAFNGRPSSEAPPLVARLQVPTTTLDTFFLEPRQQPPDFIRMDIDGGAVSALKGCGGILSTKRPLLWIESRTCDEDRAISDAITTYDYGAYRFTDRRLVTHPAGTHPDPEGVWGTLLLYPREQHARIQAAL